MRLKTKQKHILVDHAGFIKHVKECSYDDKSYVFLNELDDSISETFIEKLYFDLVKNNNLSNDFIEYLTSSISVENELDDLNGAIDGIFGKLNGIQYISFNVYSKEFSPDYKILYIVRVLTSNPGK